MGIIKGTKIMTDVISIEDFKKDKEKTKWAKILQELEDNADQLAQEGLTPEEEKGYKNYKRLINNLKRIHVQGEDQNGQE
tara:strand:+ start:253 stop:492 length:240 start_codon:yes stop_codon:yes gene_type:complete